MTIQQMLLGAKSAGGASLDIQLTAGGYGRTFSSATLNNNSALTITSTWGYSGYYAFIIPASDTYRIEARGVNGTYTPVSTPRTPENYGAQIIADVAVTAGNVLIFMAGQQDNSAVSDGQGAGGGGMSGVAYSTNTTNSTSSVNTSTALVIAGGGGGSCYNGHYGYTTSTARGYANTGQVGRAGLHSGYTAEGHGWTVGGGGQASTASYSVAAWNGGGFNTDGTGTSARSGGSHGGAFRNGGVGGYGQGASGGHGGFGGGGGGAQNCGYGGGGGGYSGGGSGGYASSCGGHGGGGGSYYTGSLVTAQNYSSAFGYVRIRSSDLY